VRRGGASGSVPGQQGGQEVDRVAPPTPTPNPDSPPGPGPRHPHNAGVVPVDVGRVRETELCPATKGKGKPWDKREAHGAARRCHTHPRLLGHPKHVGLHRLQHIRVGAPLREGRAGARDARVRNRLLDVARGGHDDGHDARLARARAQPQHTPACFSPTGHAAWGWVASAPQAHAAAARASRAAREEQRPAGPCVEAPQRRSAAPAGCRRTGTPAPPGATSGTRSRSSPQQCTRPGTACCVPRHSQHDTTAGVHTTHVRARAGRAAQRSAAQRRSDAARHGGHTHARQKPTRGTHKMFLRRSTILKLPSVVICAPTRVQEGRQTTRTLKHKTTSRGPKPNAQSPQTDA
jgi:hypothetical protein